MLSILVLLINLGKPAFANTNHDGDITLTGNEILTIENTTYIQKGNIFVKDNSSLIIKDASLIMNDRYHEEFLIWVTDNAKLEVIRSKIESILPQEVVVIQFFDTSNLIIQDTEFTEEVLLEFGNPSSGDGPVSLFWGNAQILNATVGGMFVVLSPSGGGNIRFSNSSMGAFSFAF